MNDEGDFCCDQFDITQFYGVQSLLQVYEALLFYLSNIEISITEKLGFTTLREDYDSVANCISHQRLVSCDDNGVVFDINNVKFMKFVNQSFGVVATDFVDMDDLHPYQSDMNVRKDVVAVTLLTAHRRLKTDESLSEDKGRSLGEDNHEVVVAMRRAIFVKLRHSDLDLSDSILQKVREDIGCWSDISIKAMRDYLVSKACNRS